jgi:hypothetical protein
MTDNQLIQLFLPIIQGGLVNDGYTDVAVKQFNQPTQQGANSGPTVYFSKIGDRRYGFLRRNSTWQPLISQMTHVEEQSYETTFQIMALVRQNPSNISLPTASDLVNEVAAIMQSDNTLQILNNSDVGILRVMDIRNPYFTDDQDIFEASPSFDFTLVHGQTRVSQDKIFEEFEFDFVRV